MTSEDRALVRRELVACLTRLSEKKSDWRIGQMIGNLTEIAGYSKPGSHWDVPDEQLLAACKYLLEEGSEP